MSLLFVVRETLSSVSFCCEHVTERGTSLMSRSLTMIVEAGQRTLVNHMQQWSLSHLKQISEFTWAWRGEGLSRCFSSLQ